MDIPKTAGSSRPATEAIKARTTPTKLSPIIRNVQTVAAILIHAAGGDFVPYDVVASNVEAEIRAGTFGGNDLEPDEQIQGVIMGITSRLIRSGLLECNRYDERRGRISYGQNTAIRVSNAMSICLEQEAYRIADPTEDAPYFGSKIADELVERMGNVYFKVMNSAGPHTRKDHLSFTFGKDITLQNIAAAQEFAKLFEADTDVRKGIVARCFSEGAVYLDLEDADLGFKDHDNSLN